VAYAVDLKSTLLGVPPELLAERGAVDPDVAVAMATGARQRCGADWALASTGVAGPDPQGGIAPGTAFVAVAGPGGTAVRALALTGDRAAVRRGTVIAALALLAHHLGDLAPEHAPESGPASGWGPDVDVAGSG
jgi:nicotinamide-nucleotide amidase